MSYRSTLLPGTQIEIINEVPKGTVRHALFDFDGTISLLREGWPEIMAPVCVEVICGDTAPTPEIEQAVAHMIDETTGIQTIFQMEKLVDMVRAYGLVPESKILDAQGYKKIYLDRLMVPVNERLRRLAAGELTIEQVTVRGAHHMLDLLEKRGVALYVFSGTDRDDVVNEAKQVRAARYFEEIWGAIGSVEDYSKEKVLREIIAQHNLHGNQVMAVGDGPVEIRNVKAEGGIAIGVCSDEKAGHGWDDTKRNRLLKAGADILIPDFAEADKLMAYLFG
jgi:phosphoglycolate phosphatase-like HAD superfamily hydrolase